MAFWGSLQGSLQYNLNLLIFLLLSCSSFGEVFTQKKRAYDKQMQDAFQPTEPIKIQSAQEFIQYIIDCNEYIQKSNQYLIAQYGSQNIPDQPGIKRVLLFGVENHMDNYGLLECLPHKDEQK